MKFAYVLIALFALLPGCAPHPAANSAPPVQAEANAAPVVILVSIDAMRPDYLGKGNTPNLDALARSGVQAKGLRPSFPTKTYPNHYTLVTGLRPDRNGIVGNNMLDAAMPGQFFYPANTEVANDRRWWDGAEPIWVTAEKHGIHAGVLFWPGSEAAIGGVRPSRFLPYDDDMPPSARVATVLKWLGEPERPGFVALYFDLVDNAGHNFGPDAPQTARAVAEVDTAIGELVAGLAQRGVPADLVVLSDHGLAATAADRVVRVEDIAPQDSYRLIAWGTYAGFDPIPGKEDVLASALLAPHDHLQCWRKGELPERLHYGQNPRVPAFICLVETGWEFDPEAFNPKRGSHGYDNLDPDMMAMFMAKGPGFASGKTIGVFDNVDVYSLVMHLLALPALPNDGTIAPFETVLAD